MVECPLVDPHVFNQIPVHFPVLLRVEGVELLDPQDPDVVAGGEDDGEFHRPARLLLFNSAPVVSPFNGRDFSSS